MHLNSKCHIQVKFVGPTIQVNIQDCTQHLHSHMTKQGAKEKL